jgi:uroporphyrinogen III methyltransferase/synthase
MMQEGKAGKVWLVGAGPGDAGLLTLKGKTVLDAADTVVHDRLVSEEILLAIPPEARLIDAGKSSGHHPVPQEEINRILIEEARSGRKVVRLKGGDPFLFGRGGEEVLELAAAGIPFEVVPGVSSALAVPASAGIPVTHRGLSAALHVITWHGKDGGPRQEDLERLAALEGTLVILMGAAALADIGERLVRAGFPPDIPSAVIENGTTPSQRLRVVPLARLGEAPPPEPAASPPPALVVVGGVCAFPARLSGGVQAEPLAGRRIVVTSPEPRNGELCRRVRALGGEAVPFPCLKTIPLTGDPSFKEAGQYGWLVFTSAAGVEIFFDGYLRSGGDFRSLSNCRFAAVGPATAEALTKRGFIPDFIPASHNGHSLGLGLAEKMSGGGAALLIRSRQAAPGLPQALAEGGVPFRELAVYETVPAEGGKAARNIIEAGMFDLVFFTSPSAVSAFIETFPRLSLPNIRALCIGETTAFRAREFGMEVHTAEEAGNEAMCRLAGELMQKPSASLPQDR